MFTLSVELRTVPTYTYTCTACNDVIEKRQSFSDPPLTTCEQCGGTLRKIIHPVGIVFKGSGWYITDSRSSTSAASGSSSASSASKDSSTDSSKDAGAKESSPTKDTSASTGSSTPSPSTSSEKVSEASPQTVEPEGGLRPLGRQLDSLHLVVVFDEREENYVRTLF